MRLVDADKLLHIHKEESKQLGKDWTADDLAAEIDNMAAIHGKPNNRTFLVEVERATPACSMDCPFLDIYADRLEFYADGVKTNKNKFTCMNADVCKHMNNSMKKEHGE